MASSLRLSRSRKRGTIKGRKGTSHRASLLGRGGGKLRSGLDGRRVFPAYGVGGCFRRETIPSVRLFPSGRECEARRIRLIGRIRLTRQFRPTVPLRAATP